MLKAIKHILKCCKLYRDSADLNIEVVSLDLEITGTAEPGWGSTVNDRPPPPIIFCRNRKEGRSRKIQSSITSPHPRFLDLPLHLKEHGKLASCNFLHLQWWVSSTPFGIHAKISERDTPTIVPMQKDNIFQQKCSCQIFFTEWSSDLCCVL